MPIPITSTARVLSDRSRANMHGSGTPGRRGSVAKPAHTIRDCQGSSAIRLGFRFFDRGLREPADVSLQFYDVLGRLLRVFLFGDPAPSQRPFPPCLEKSLSNALITASLSLLREPRIRPAGFPRSSVVISCRLIAGSGCSEPNALLRIVGHH
jgi:hypothetical protein